MSSKYAYAPKFRGMFDYLSGIGKPQSLLKSADGVFVFGRADPRVAQKAAEIYEAGLVSWILVTGGIGKDSGPLPALGLSEAAYLAALLRWTHFIRDSDILVETKATCGIENSKFGMNTISHSCRKHESIILLTHATSLRRLSVAHLLKAEALSFKATYQFVATDYPFDPDNPVDQAEAAKELMRVATWPDHKNEQTGKSEPWSLRQDDLPADLVEFAAEWLKSTNQSISTKAQR